MLHSAVFRRWLSAVAPARRHAAGTPRRPARCRTARRGLVLEQLEDRTVLSPVSLVVTSLADSGLGTLREAITTANGDTSNAYIIDFAVTGAINLTTSAPDLSNNTTSALDLSNNITIQGPGAGNLTVQRATDLPFGIFVIDTGWTVSISGLTIANGATPTNGGGIFNFGTLKVTNCTLDNNSALGDGGGIENSGTVTVTNSTLDNNSAAGNGGGIGNAETATGTVTVTNCTLDNNSATGTGGGIDNGETATVTNCTLDNNSASYAGGGIDNFRFATVTNCTLDNNSTAGNGGGINDYGTVTVTNCTLDYNSAAYNGGGIDNGETATVTNCTLDYNSAAGNGGGIENDWTATVTNCTLDNNSAANNGGGIFNFDTATATVTNCTLDNNSAAVGGGIINLGTATANNTIIAGNHAPADPDFGGILVSSSSYNLIGDGTGMTGISNGTQGNQVGTAATPINPLLGPLQNNGGSTQTLALLPGSPAIDAGSNALAVDANGNALTTDQRGVARIVNGTVDIGAFESRSFSIAITGGNGQSTTVYTGFLNPLVVTVTSPHGDPVQGGVVTFTAPGGGAGATFPASSSTTATATINPVGQAAVAATANTVAGRYAVMATARGATFAAGFSLTNTPGAAASIALTAGTGQSTTVGYAFATPLQVLVTDQYNNPVPGVVVTFAAPTSGPSGTFSGGAAVTTDAHGIAAPTFTANTLAGSYSVTATASGLMGSPVNFNLTNTPDVASSFVVSGFPSPSTAGTAHGFTVTARDRYGNVATGYAGTVHFTSTDGQAVLPGDAGLTNGTGSFGATLKTAGTQSITATDTVTTSLTGTQSGITVNPFVASRFIIAAPTTVTPGVAFSFTVTAVDMYGNVATGYNGTIHFTSTDKRAVLPGNTILIHGTGTFTATFSTRTAGTNQTLTATDIASPPIITGSQVIVVDPPPHKKK